MTIKRNNKIWYRTCLQLKSYCHRTIVNHSVSGFAVHVCEIYVHESVKDKLKDDIYYCSESPKSHAKVMQTCQQIFNNQQVYKVNIFKLYFLKVTFRVGQSTKATNDIENEDIAER